MGVLGTATCATISQEFPHHPGTVFGFQSYDSDQGWFDLICLLSVFLQIGNVKLDYGVAL